MKFDRSKPYGEVFGMSQVKFVQNGIEYNGMGQPVSAPVLATTSNLGADDSPAPESPVAVNDVEAAKAFLSNLLSNGPIAKSAVFAEADKNNQNWGIVKDAAADMGVKSVNIGPKKQEYWQLNKE